MLIVKRLQTLLEAFAQMGMLVWQFQRFAKMRRFFIPIETRLVRRHLKKNATGGAEIDGPEIVPVLDRSDRMAGLGQGFAHLLLRMAICNRKSDMMDRALLEGMEPMESLNIAAANFDERVEEKEG